MTRTAPAAVPGPRATPDTTASPGRRQPPPATPAVSVPGTPSPTHPRRSSGRSADGRRWELLTDPTGVAAVTSAGTVAEARVSERDDQVIVEFWADGPGLPSELSAHLVTQAFSLPAVRLLRPVLVCVPRHDGEVLAQVRRHVQGARSRAAGVTCMVEGRVREDELSPAGPAPGAVRPWAPDAGPGEHR